METVSGPPGVTVMRRPAGESGGVGRTYFRGNPNKKRAREIDMSVQLLVGRKLQVLVLASFSLTVQHTTSLGQAPTARSELPAMLLSDSRESRRVAIAQLSEAYGGSLYPLGLLADHMLSDEAHRDYGRPGLRWHVEVCLRCLISRGMVGRE